MIIKGSEILADKSFGRLTFDKNSKLVDNKTIYDVASLTKVIATTPVIMKLIKKKYLNLNHEVYQFYPEFRGKWKDEVTIKHLLTHSSGLKPYIQYFKDSKYKKKEDIIYDIISNQDLIYEPGIDSKYSDLGMILLMDISEKVTGRKFEELVRAWVLNPLDMNNSFFNPSKDLFYKIAPTEEDYVFRDTLIHGVVHDENAFIMGGVSGHAGLFSNASDIANYAQMMLNLGLYNGKRIFSRRSISKFTKRQNMPISSDFALGWDTPSTKGNSTAGDLFSNNSYGHLGFTGTSFWVDSEQEIIIILLTNRIHPSRDKKGMYQLRRSFHNEVMTTIKNRGV